jgi:hypothetical protein
VTVEGVVRIIASKKSIKPKIVYKSGGSLAYFNVGTKDKSSILI